jgi:CO/xanthine dehydrogenase Mo-binding subunit
MSKEAFTVVGQPLPKIDAWGKVTGETRYADDLVLPRMAYGKLLRSSPRPRPHPRIDTTRGPSAAGVYAVDHRPGPAAREVRDPAVSQDEEALCTEKVRMVGDAVPRWLRWTRRPPRPPCRLIDVTYEAAAGADVDPGVAGPSRVASTSTATGPTSTRTWRLQFGDVDAAFAPRTWCARTSSSSRATPHLPMEQHAAVAQHGADGKLTLWSSTQTPHYVHRLLAKISTCRARTSG